METELRGTTKEASRPVPHPAALLSRPVPLHFQTPIPSRVPQPSVPSRPVPYDQFSKKVKNSQNIFAWFFKSENILCSGGATEWRGRAQPLETVWNRPETTRVRPEKSENFQSNFLLAFLCTHHNNQGLYRETSSD